MDDLGPDFAQRRFQFAQTEGIPYGAQSTPHFSVKTLVEQFIAVAGKFNDRVSTIAKKTCFGYKCSVFTAWCRRAVKIMDEENFHNREIITKLIGPMEHGPSTTS